MGHPNVAVLRELDAQFAALPQTNDVKDVRAAITRALQQLEDR